MTMQSGDVLEVVELIDASAIDAWLDGGWGVDALLGSQTRPHDDLDLVVRFEHVDLLKARLAERGFTRLQLWPDSPEGFVLDDPDGRRVDIHPVRFDAEGNGIQRIAKGEWAYPAAGFLGTGRIDGRPVRCLTPEVQVLCHAGYEMQEDDIHDMRALRDYFGVELLPHQVSAIEAVDGQGRS